MHLWPQIELGSPAGQLGCGSVETGPNACPGTRESDVSRTTWLVQGGEAAVHRAAYQMAAAAPIATSSFPRR